MSGMKQQISVGRSSIEKRDGVFNSKLLSRPPIAAPTSNPFTKKEGEVSAGRAHPNEGTLQTMNTINEPIANIIPKSIQSHHLSNFL